jgi:2-haloacid dehalogenase
MHRHTFLNLLLGATAGASLTGCGAPSPSRLPSPGGSAGQPGPRPKIRAICFDLFTLFDPRSVSRVAQPILRVDAGAVCEAWRTRLFDYAWLHAAAGQYTDFRTLAVDALKFALSTRKLDLSPAQQEALVEAYSQLDPWPDTRSALAAWKLLGIALAPLANYSPVMLERLLAHSGLSDLFDAQISTASARTFKPHPNAYALGAKAPARANCVCRIWWLGCRRG